MPNRDLEQYRTPKSTTQTLGLILMGCVIGAGSTYLGLEIVGPQIQDSQSGTSTAVAQTKLAAVAGLSGPIGTANLTQAQTAGEEQITIREEAGQVWAEFDISGFDMPTGEIHEINDTLRLSAQQSTLAALEMAARQYPNAEAVHVAGLGQVVLEGGNASPTTLITQASYFRPTLDQLKIMGKMIFDPTTVWQLADHLQLAPQINGPAWVQDAAGTPTPDTQTAPAVPAEGLPPEMLPVP